MQSDPNPYESPVAVAVEAPAADLRRTGVGTFLVFVWILEGGLKASLLGAAIARGFNPLQSLAREYHGWHPLWFFLVLSFFVVETIGPWIGIYYLTGRRARTITFESAMIRTLLVACASAIGVTLLMMLYCELAGPPR